MVLHWGSCKVGTRDWSMPEPDIFPEGSVVMHKAVETPFLNCDDDECDVEISGAKVPLQRITITLPAGKPARPNPEPCSESEQDT